tara:strand:- start:17422 stop:18339 length:918 start_codon:yes stop_codon:yes gene_type:complete
MNLKKYQMDMRDEFFSYLINFMKIDKKFIILSNDYGSPKLDYIKKKFGNRFINCGITEQNIVSVSAGLSSRGFKPIIYSISTFITLRSFEQLKLDISVMEMPLLVLSVGAGYAYSMDGPTHHAIDDISILNTLNNCEIYSPSESSLFLNKSTLNFKFKGLKYLRLDRGKLNRLGNFYKIKRTNYRLREYNKKCLVISSGYMTQIITFGILNKTIKNVSHMDIYKIKPFDLSILKFIKKYNKIIVIEEHIKPGGLFTIINDFISLNKININIISLCLQESTSYNYGERDYLHKQNKIDIDTLNSNI